MLMVFSKAMTDSSMELHLNLRNLFWYFRSTFGLFLMLLVIPSSSGLDQAKNTTVKDITLVELVWVGYCGRGSPCCERDNVVVA